MLPTNLAAFAALACVVLLAVWFMRRRKPVAGPKANRSSRDFEARAASAFAAQGYQRIGGSQNAGELLMRRDRETVLIHCHAWRESKVAVDTILALQREMSARGASGGFVLTEGRFSREAAALARECNIRLVEGRALGTLLAQAR